MLSDSLHLKASPTLQGGLTCRLFLRGKSMENRLIILYDMTLIWISSFLFSWLIISCQWSELVRENKQWSIWTTSIHQAMCLIRNLLIHYVNHSFNTLTCIDILFCSRLNWASFRVMKIKNGTEIKDFTQIRNTIMQTIMILIL